MMQAATLVDQFGEELEADFHEVYDLDLLDWFRGRHPWGKLLRLSRQLPRHSRYVAALYDDPEVASAILEQEQETPDDAPEPDMTLYGWTRELELLTGIADRLGSLESTLVAVNTQKGQRPKVTPLRRPRTEVDRMRYRANREEAFAIAAIFRPRGD